jgi:hypothetical protein
MGITKGVARSFSAKTMIKSTVSVLALVGASLLMHTAAKANDPLSHDYYCYAEDSSGVVHNLREMCLPNTPAVSAPASGASLSGAAFEDVISTASVVHADAFCEARARGGTRMQANDAANASAASFLVSAGLSADDIPYDDLITAADEASQLLCPELQPTGLYD